MGKSLDVAALVERHGLEHAFDSANASVWAADDEILIVVPILGAVDDEASARNNAALQADYFERRGRKGSTVIFFDRMASQDRAARAIYQGLDWALVSTALVGGSFLTRTLASFFTSISRPVTPLRLFPEFGPALDWVRGQHATLDRRLGTRPR